MTINSKRNVMKFSKSTSNSRSFIVRTSICLQVAASFSASFRFISSVLLNRSSNVDVNSDELTKQQSAADWRRSMSLADWGLLPTSGFRWCTVQYDVGLHVEGSPFSWQKTAEWIQFPSHPPIPLGTADPTSVREAVWKSCWKSRSFGLSHSTERHPVLSRDDLLMSASAQYDGPSSPALLACCATAGSVCPTAATVLCNPVLCLRSNLGELPNWLELLLCEVPEPRWVPCTQECHRYST